MPCGVPNCIFRKVLEYSAESTRVFCGEYAGAFRRAERVRLLHLFPSQGAGRAQAWRFLGGCRIRLCGQTSFSGIITCLSFLAHKAGRLCAGERWGSIRKQEANAGLHSAFASCYRVWDVWMPYCFFFPAKMRSTTSAFLKNFLANFWMSLGVMDESISSRFFGSLKLMPVW